MPKRGRRESNASPDDEDDDNERSNLKSKSGFGMKDSFKIFAEFFGGQDPFEEMENDSFFTQTGLSGVEFDEPTMQNHVQSKKRHRKESSGKVLKRPAKA